MGTRRITLPLDVTALGLAERAASREGLSLSVWLSRAARHEAVRTGVGAAVVDVLPDALTDEREYDLAEEDLGAAG